MTNDKTKAAPTAQPVDIGKLKKEFLCLAEDVRINWAEVKAP